MVTEKIWCFFDAEGPQLQNDNAQENTVALAKRCGLGEQVGIEFYKRLSVIDDTWGDFHKIAKDPSYSSGHTLKVILPFYKAMGATSRWLYEFAKTSIRVVPNIAGVLRNLDSKYNVRLISTSYDFFIKAFCNLAGFDFDKTYCTSVKRLDNIPISKLESEILKDFMREVANAPVIEYDPKTGEVIPEHQLLYLAFTTFVWEFIYNMPVGELIRTVHPVGQAQKRQAMLEIIEKFKAPKEKAFYVGDSQTDVQCVQELKGIGLTMMFNGKGKVCDESDLMYIGEDARAIEEVANLFATHDRKWVIKHYTPARHVHHGMISAVTPQNLEDLKEMSVKKRKEFRGIHIGELT